jgi:glycosyltransferase involved in cell wall biosynthesis
MHLASGSFLAFPFGAPSATDVIASRRQVGLAPDPRVVGTEQRPVAQEGTEEILAAFACVPHLTGIHAAIFGNAPEEASLRVSAGRLKDRPRSRVLLFGSLRIRPVPHNVFFVCSPPFRPEGSIDVLVEAMESDRPLVWTDVDVVRGAVIDGAKGWSEASGGVGALASIMGEPTRDATARAAMGSAAAVWGRRQFSAEATLTSLVRDRDLSLAKGFAA